MRASTGSSSTSVPPPTARSWCCHDADLPDGRLVADLDLAALRRVDPGLLTLDDAVEHLDGRVPILSTSSRRARRSCSARGFAAAPTSTASPLCTENLTWLLHLRFAAPRVARWPSFPDIGDRRTHHVQRVVVGLWRSHAQPRRAASRRCRHPPRRDAAAPRSAREPQPPRRPALARAAAAGHPRGLRRHRRRRGSVSTTGWCPTSSSRRRTTSASTSTPGLSTTLSRRAWWPTPVSTPSPPTASIWSGWRCDRASARPVAPPVAACQGGGAYRAALIRPASTSMVHAEPFSARGDCSSTPLPMTRSRRSAMMSPWVHATTGDGSAFQPLQHRLAAAPLVQGVERHHRQAHAPRQREDGGEAAQRRAGVDRPRAESPPARGRRSAWPQPRSDSGRRSSSCVHAPGHRRAHGARHGSAAQPSPALGACGRRPRLAPLRLSTSRTRRSSSAASSPAMNDDTCDRLRLALQPFAASPRRRGAHRARSAARRAVPRTAPPAAPAAGTHMSAA